MSFLEGDIRGVASSALFDAVVGRAILQYLPEAGAVLRLLATRIGPGGVIAFQDVWPASLFHPTAHLPLRSKCASLIYRTLQRSRVHMDMELVLYRAFLEAGLPAPSIRIEVPVGDDPNVIRWFYDLVCTLASRLDKDELARAELAISKRSNRGSRGKGSRRDHLPQASRSSVPGRESLGDPTRLTGRRPADDRKRWRADIGQD